jgi:hypothetical protein
MPKSKTTKRIPAKSALDELFESAPPEAKRLLATFKAEKRNEDRKAFIDRLTEGGAR